VDGVEMGLMSITVSLFNEDVKVGVYNSPHFCRGHFSGTPGTRAPYINRLCCGVKKMLQLSSKALLIEV